MAFRFFEQMTGHHHGDYSRQELQHAVVDIMLYMMGLDRQVNARERGRVIDVMSHRFHFDDNTIREKMHHYRQISLHDVDRAADMLSESITYEDRIVLLKDLWAIVKADNKATAAEMGLFTRVADRLGIPEGDFRDHCIMI